MAKSIPEVKIGNEVYQVKDRTAREHLVEVSQTQPTSEDNKLWIKNQEAEYEVPTIDEFNDLKSAMYLKATNPVITNGKAFRADTNAETSGAYQYAKYEIQGEKKFVVYGRSFGGSGKWPLISYLNSSNEVIGTEKLVSAYYEMVPTTPPAGAKYIIVNASSAESANNDPTGAVIYGSYVGSFADDIKEIKNDIDDIEEINDKQTETFYLKVLSCAERNGYAFNALTSGETEGTYRYIKYKVGNEAGFYASGRSFGGDGKWPLVSYINSEDTVIGTEYLTSNYYNLVKCHVPEGTEYIIVNGINGISSLNDPTKAVLYAIEEGTYANDVNTLYGYASDTIQPLGELIDGKAINTDTLAFTSSGNNKCIHYTLNGEKYLNISGWAFGSTYVGYVFLNSSREKLSAQTYTDAGPFMNERVIVPTGAAEVYVNGYTKRCPPVLLKDEGKQEYVFIGDSYSARTDNWVNPCIDALNLSNGQHVRAVVSGSGFANASPYSYTGDGVSVATVPTGSRFVDQLVLAAELVSDPLAVRHVVVCGGYNDSKSSYYEPASTQYVGSTVLEQYIAYFIRTAIALFPRAKVHVGMVAYSVPGSDGDRNELIFEHTNPIYNLCVNYGAQYISGANILDANDITDDNVHPTADGAKKLGRAIANSIKGGGTMGADLFQISKEVVIGNTHLTENTLQRLIGLLN